MKSLRIAIDGPAASGKSTIARRVAEKLGFTYVDTGAMYRALALKAFREGVDIADTDSLRESIVEKTDFAIIDGELAMDCRPISNEIRSEKVSVLSSRIARIPDVRSFMIEEQRKLAKDGRVVMEGRDIGTVVLPDAEIKIFLTASASERARRRTLQLRSMGQCADEAEVLRDIRQRDLNDSSRSLAPLRSADDAITIDTTNMTLDEIIEIVVEKVQEN